jgi:hypothetical protein
MLQSYGMRFQMDDFDIHPKHPSASQSPRASLAACRNIARFIAAGG